MADPWITPGQAAEQAFETGLRAAALAWVVLFGALYWGGAIAPITATIVLVLFFPAYLLVVAAALSKWLGFDKGPTDLRPVTRPRR